MSTVRTRPARHLQQHCDGTGRRRRNAHRDHRAWLIRKLIERDGSHCVWCGTPLADRGEEVTVDYLIPRSVCHSMRPVSLVLSYHL